MSGTFDTVAEPLRGELQLAADAWDGSRNTERLWSRDATLWTGADEARWLGWLTAPEDFARELGNLQAFSAELRAEGLRHVLCSAWADRACAPRCWPKRLGSCPADRGCTYSTRPCRRRSRPSSTKWICRGRSSSSRASRAPRSSRTSFTPTSTIAWSPRLAVKPAGRHFVAITDPGIEARDRRHARRIPTHLRGHPLNRRTLLGAVAVRARARGGDGPRPAALARERGGDGDDVRRRQSRRARTRACLSGCCSVPARITASTS